MQTKREIKLGAGMKSLKTGLTGFIFLAFCLIAVSAYGRLPEPDNIVYGVVPEGTATVTAKHGGEELAVFTAALQPNLAPYYVLRLPIDSLEPQLPGTVRPGDEVELFINGGSVAAATFAAGEKGEITQLHLTDVDEDEDGMLDAWEEAYFGSVTYSDGTGNDDGDFFTDLEEFLLDTSPLVRTAAGPQISINPDPLDFGSVDVNGGLTLTLTISNIGDADLAIVSLSLSGVDAADFSLINDNCSGQIIAAGSNRTVQISFAPSFEGDALAQLAIVSNNVRNSPLAVEVRGNGNNLGILYVDDENPCDDAHPYYCRLGDANGAFVRSGSGNEIRITTGTYAEGDLVFSQGFMVWLRGGWDEDYISNAGASTTIAGSLTITDGCLVVEGIVISGDDTHQLAWLDRSVFGGLSPTYWTNRVTFR